jgi:hypothetical protein
MFTLAIEKQSMAVGGWAEHVAKTFAKLGST